MKGANTKHSVDGPSERQGVAGAPMPETSRHWIVWLVAAQLAVLYAPTAAWLWVG